MSMVRWALLTGVSYACLVIGIVPRLQGSTMDLNPEFTAAVLGIGFVALVMRDFGSFQSIRELEEIWDAADSVETGEVDPEEVLKARPVTRRRRR